jgi:hypothetical protein
VILYLDTSSLVKLSAFDERLVSAAGAEGRDRSA